MNTCRLTKVGLFLLPVALLGCGGGGSDEPNTTDPRKTLSISLIDGAPPFRVGDEFTIEIAASKGIANNTQYAVNRSAEARRQITVKNNSASEDGTISSEEKKTITYEVSEDASLETISLTLSTTDTTTRRVPSNGQLAMSFMLASERVMNLEGGKSIRAFMLTRRLIEPPANDPTAAAISKVHTTLAVGNNGFVPSGEFTWSLVLRETDESIPQSPTDYDYSLSERHLGLNPGDWVWQSITTEPQYDPQISTFTGSATFQENIDSGTADALAYSQVRSLNGSHISSCDSVPQRTAATEHTPAAFTQANFDTDTTTQRGANVTVAVLDTGLEICHPDLASQVIADRSYHFHFEQSDPFNWDRIGDHGTTVAGLIAATKGNNLGAHGLAPSARLIAFNILNSDQLTSDFADVLGMGTDPSKVDVRDVDIFNMSFGSVQRAATNLGPTVQSAIEHGVESLRSNKGAIYIKAAGNSFGWCLADNIALSNEIGCVSASTDYYNNRPELIVVGAIDDAGQASSYSSQAASLWIAAPGGVSGQKVGVDSTDQVGCDRGYNSVLYVHENTDPSTNSDPHCDYADNLQGTSFSTPIISATAALMLEANPNLSWIDVKHNLADTANPNGSKGEAGATLELSDGTYTAMLGWQETGAGLLFHNRYGFGAVNVDSAVATAEVFTPTTSSTSKLNSSNDDPKAIADHSIHGALSSIEITEDRRVVGVQACVNVKHPFPFDLGIELQSPSGTKAILNPVFNEALALEDQLDDWCLAASTFFSESSMGTWQLRVVDARAQNTGYLDSWSLNLWVQ